MAELLAVFGVNNDSNKPTCFRLIWILLFTTLFTADAGDGRNVVGGGVTISPPSATVLFPVFPERAVDDDAL